ncbi:hypothetical protein BRADI_1g24442v3 [Brachypodium distachyon]|uniref:Uncharacterized protein n=1 Tax=Brachypodium distachyon TaxID=15368 RepID=A0A2K2DKW4_BRADI|nr:hypothetical protein BRADI_1g24442v3 [Brachypodium distachyon]
MDMEEHGQQGEGDKWLVGNRPDGSNHVIKLLRALIEAQVNEEKRKNKKLVDDMMQMKAGLEAELAERKILMQELKSKLDERRKKDVEVRDFAIVSCTRPDQNKIDRWSRTLRSEFSPLPAAKQSQADRRRPTPTGAWRIQGPAAQLGSSSSTHHPGVLPLLVLSGRHGRSSLA